MRLRSRRVAVGDLEIEHRDQMYRLFSQYYDRTDRRRFEADLDAKHWIIQLLDPLTGQIRGFSTQVLLNVRTQAGRQYTAVFSGDTVVEPEHWGDNLLIREWGRLSMELIESTRPEPLYWFLISKGYKTYRFLPVFFRQFYPRYDQPTPEWAKQLLDAFGREVGAQNYNSQRGLILATADKDRLRPGIADMTSTRLMDPHVRFFAQRNPKYDQGDELCCIAPLQVSNFTPAGIRLLDSRHRPAQWRRREDLSGKG